MANTTCCSCDTTSSKSDSSGSDDQNETLVRISLSHALNDIQPNLNENAQLADCIRCGHSLDRRNVIFVTVRPPFMQHRCSKISISVNDGTRCSKCLLPQSLHCGKKSGTESDGNGSSDSTRGTSSLGSPSSVESDRSLTDGEGGTMGECGESPSDEDGNHDERKLSTPHQHPEFCANPCTDCHIAMIRECCRADSRVIGLPEVITLMLQVPVTSEWTQSNSVQDQTFAPVVECEIGDNDLEMNQESFVSAVSDGGVLPGSGGGYSKGMPNLDPEAEAAYQSHLRNLIPCTHCGRTFNPDRVLRHENACVERPRRRQLKAIATA